MSKTIKRIFFFNLFLIVFSLSTVACQVIQQLDEGGEIVDSSIPPDLENASPDFVFVQGRQIRQWAVQAEARSEYANPEWAAIQATGNPDTLRCGDYQTAWASAGSDSIEWLEVKFPLAVSVTAVNIIQSFNPNQVVRVELVGAYERALEIYYQPPFQVDQPCPYILSISVDKTKVRYDTVRITIDQSILGLGWNQIDAVELVGESN